MSLITRLQLDRIMRLVSEEPVVALNGPRAVGKSTLLHQLAETLRGEVIDLDDMTVRGQVAADPSLFIRRDGPVFIDEHQHVPELLDYIKAELNRDTKPGRYILTGSTNFFTTPTLHQTLAGRVHVEIVRPLSQLELSGGTIKNAAHNNAAKMLESPHEFISPHKFSCSFEQYLDRIFAGGFPIALARSEAARERWFDGYVGALIEGDLGALRNLQQRDAMPAIFERLMASTAEVINLKNISDSLGLKLGLVREYARLLEVGFAFHTLPAFGTTLSSRINNKPKIHAFDSGLASHFSGINKLKLIAKDPSAVTEFGHIFESFVVNEVLTQLGLLDTRYRPSHFRSADGHEVDLVLEARDNTVRAIEVKWSATLGSRDLRGLKYLKSKLGSKLVSSILLYRGDIAYSPEEGVIAIPVSALWANT